MTAWRPGGIQALDGEGTGALTALVLAWAPRFALLA
jgi:hypothetical protein